MNFPGSFSRILLWIACAKPPIMEKNSKKFKVLEIFRTHFANDLGELWEHYRNQDQRSHVENVDCWKSTKIWLKLENNETIVTKILLIL